MNGWRKIPDAAEYYGLSVRTMRTLMKEGFPHSRLPSGTILVELEAGNEWLRSFDVQQRDQGIVDEILDGIGQPTIHTCGTVWRSKAGKRSFTTDKRSNVMIWDYCHKCGRLAVYRAEHETWKRLCVFCWKQREGVKLSVSDKYALRLEDQLRDTALSFSRRDLTDIVSLCHPDKHGGSEKATKVTQKILDIRDIQ